LKVPVNAFMGARIFDVMQWTNQN